MNSRLTWITMLVLVVYVATLAPSPALAQTPFPLQVAEDVAACMTTRMADAMYASAWVEPAPATGWRVVIPLRGQPAAQRQGIQSPPPATNTLAWVDLYRYASPRDVPPDIDNLGSYIMVTAAGDAYAVYHGGYFWLRMRNASQGCIETVTNSRMWPI
ncbi:MAG: hypothetical protein AB7K36_05360 [Chloroflexota bacterium]